MSSLPELPGLPPKPPAFNSSNAPKIVSNESNEVEQGNVEDVVSGSSMSTTKPVPPVYSGSREGNKVVSGGFNVTQPPPPVVLPKTVEVEPKKKKNFLLLFFVFLLLVVSCGLMLFSFFQLQIISELEKEISSVESKNAELVESLDAKETFNNAFVQYNDMLKNFVGQPVAGSLDVELGQSLLNSSYENRYDANVVVNSVIALETETRELNNLLASVNETKEYNISGSEYEAFLDGISSGLSIYMPYDSNLNNVCEQDNVAGCVKQNEPRKVNINLNAYSSSNLSESEKVWLTKAVLWHEHAHVLQFHNWDKTSEYLGFFGGDLEIMADCFTAINYDENAIKYIYDKGCSADQKNKIIEWQKDIEFSLPVFVQGG